MEKIIYRGVEFNHPDDDERELYRSKTARAVIRGKLIRKNCEICGDDEVHAHHEKYSEYLNVRWLCPAHHFKVHSIFNRFDQLTKSIFNLTELVTKYPGSMGWQKYLDESIIELKELDEKHRVTKELLTGTINHQQ